MKNTLRTYPVVTAGDLSGSVTSSPTDIRNLDNIAYQASWTGTPTGTFDVQGSLDYSPGGGMERVANAGTWTNLGITGVAAAGSADNALIDLNQLSFPWIRIVYTRSSGTGTLTVNISGKAV